MNNKHTAMMSAILGAATALTGCLDTDAVMEDQFAGVEAEVALAPLAVYDGTQGLQFASEEVAREWLEEAPGVWRHGTTERRLIVGAHGHQSAIALAQGQLEQLRADGAQAQVIADQEALLARVQAAAVDARDQGQTEASCNIATYNGPSSPLTGYIGGAALAEISCVNGTVVFTVMSQVCTGTTGCGPVNVQTAIPGPFPGLWGSARSGYGWCDSWVSLSPSSIYDSGVYICD